MSKESKESKNAQNPPTSQPPDNNGKDEQPPGPFGAFISRFKAHKALSQAEMEAVRRESSTKTASILWQHSDVPRRFYDPRKRETYLQHNGWKMAFVALNNLLQLAPDGILVLICGGQGTGKTALGCELLRNCCSRLETAKFSTVESFIRLMRGFNTDQEMVDSQFFTPNTLFLDDVPTSPMSEWERRQLYHLLNSRFNNNRDTLLGLRCNPPEAASLIGEDLVDRSNDGGAVAHLCWPSFRSLAI